MSENLAVTSGSGYPVGDKNILFQVNRKQALPAGATSLDKSVRLVILSYKNPAGCTASRQG